ncbi:MAG: hypothetical protein Q7R94_01205 [bacterium]|nr:hypothetical protein [bacterium]
MAIIIEEEGGKINIVRVITWIAILAIIVIAVYYVFFAQPQLVEIAVPPTFRNIETIAKGIGLKPDEIIGGPAFRSLQPYITLPVPGNAGRPNPFLPL